jgi:hypothetical protein
MIAMKTIHAFLMLLLTVFYVNAGGNENNDYFRQGAVWSYYHYSGFSEGPYTFFRYTLDGDTMIGGNTYQKMYKFTSCAYNPQEALYLGAVRMDAGKVYCPPDEEGRFPVVDGEAVVYDFTLQVGDSVERGGYSVAYVIMVDSVMIGDTTRESALYSIT